MAWREAICDLGRASMGPRLVNRGNGGNIAAVQPTNVALQWGRDWLIAEITPMPTLKPRAYAASMGPRLVNRGNPCSCWILEAVRTASMGPRLVNRGNQAYNRYYCRCGYCASMGPRLVNRGNPRADSQSVSDIKCFNGAAIS